MVRENGYLFMFDRADGMVISAELENVIAAHPAVIEVAVFGTPCAVVCMKPRASVAEKELVDLCSVHLGNQAQGAAGTVLERARAAGCRTAMCTRCRADAHESRG